MKQFIAVIGLALLTACSGSTSSSGVGSPHATSYAGIYDGTLTVTVSVDGVALTDTVPYRITVGVDGAVADAIPGVTLDGVCTGAADRYYLSDNILELNEQITCSSAILGSCSVPAEMRLVFNATAASAFGSAQYFCGSTVFQGQFSGYLTKRA